MAQCRWCSINDGPAPRPASGSFGQWFTRAVGRAGIGWVSDDREQPRREEGHAARPSRRCGRSGTIAGMQFGRSYEEFDVGAVYKHWPGKTVTEYDDHLFCLLTMNHHPLHLDSHYAQETTQFGQNVVVGSYIYSLLLGMSVADVSGKAIANLEVESLRHVAPTFHGDTIYGETTVLDKWESTSKNDRGVVQVETKGYKQDGTLVCIFRRKVMVPKNSYLEARGGEHPGRPTLVEPPATS